MSERHILQQMDFFCFEQKPNDDVLVKKEERESGLGARHANHPKPPSTKPPVLLHVIHALTLIAKHFEQKLVQ